MAGRFRAGYTGAVQTGNSFATLQNWTTKYTGNALDTTNFESNGAYEGIVGVGKVDWTVKGNWDASSNPMSDPIGFFPRDNGTNLTLNLSTQDAFKWSFPAWICHDSNLQIDTNGLVQFDAAGSSNGTFTPPGGQAPPLP